MNRKTSSFCLKVFLVTLLFFFSCLPVFGAHPNEAAIMKYLIRSGKISPNLKPQEKQRILRYYLVRKGLYGKSLDPGNPLAAKKVSNKDGKGFYSAPGIQLNKTKYYNVLVILVEFAGSEGGMLGPLHNNIPKPNPNDNTSYWVNDFNRKHYQDMLFSRNPAAKSLANYYFEQSGGSYSVSGYVTDWVKVPHSEWYYGADSNDDVDNLNGPVWRIVVDAVNALGDSINWSEFDKEDPYDLDNDGNLFEPDNYIDHVMIIHAGAGQEAGGGAQGSDAIWSHSWWVDYGSGQGPSGLGGVKCGSSNKWIGPYTIQPEDGAVGVFAHEFGHDLGLPDVYDTLYSGEESAGFYSLMSSGSWLGDKGKPLGTSPSSMSIWEKYILGYVDPIVVNFGTKKNVSIYRTNYKGVQHKSVRINLPEYSYSTDINLPYSGSYEWWSGSEDLLDNTLTLNKEFDLSTATSARLEFYAWYEIEKDWDYAYVEVNDGTGWKSLAGNITTNEDPNGNNLGNGITGNSNGWLKATFDLSNYLGKKIKFRFRYVTDQAIHYKGMTIDDIYLFANGNLVFFDDVEQGNIGYTNQGWTIINGTVEKKANHYYMLEYRTASGFDSSMLNWYNFVDYLNNTAEFFEANPGVLMWYRNTRYSDNWVGLHPWSGFLLLVDSHPRLITASGSNSLAIQTYGYDLELPFRTRIQLYDASFSTKPAKTQTITSWYGYSFPTTLPSLQATTKFDDSLIWLDTTYYEIALNNQDETFYWDIVAQSMNSVLTPTYGVNWSLRGMDDEKAYVLIDNASKKK
ncbi:MAG: immune inhibitor A [Actinobacteria bacterium]|nr:immune inhibitor A [Actinomycetota bacterium]